MNIKKEEEHGPFKFFIRSPNYNLLYIIIKMIDLYDNYFKIILILIYD